jgi:apolipoprotein N-acyltransferase
MIPSSIDNCLNFIPRFFGTLCVTTTIVIPNCSLAPFNKFHTTSAEKSSRFPVGSSAIIIFGLCASARATATLCCSPPLSSFG